MPRDDLKKRIEALNKQPMRNVPDEKPDEPGDIKGLRRKLGKRSIKLDQDTRAAVAGASGVNPTDVHATPSSSTPPEPIVYSRSTPAASRKRQKPPEERDFGPPVALEEIVEGCVAEATNGPGFCLIEKSAHELEAAARLVHQRFVQLTGYPGGQAVTRIASTCKSDNIAPGDVLFMDIETTGLGLTPVFLVGTMECAGDGFVFRQYFARDYSEESSIVSAFAKRMQESRLLVTFNGKTFDLPFLQNRAVANRLKFPQPQCHLDLLHEARRIYRGELPDCRLQTLEHWICGRSREDDIPGSEIPEAYHEFVRTGNANKIGLILLHNLYDLLTMADLMHQMWHRE